MLRSKSNFAVVVVTGGSFVANVSTLAECGLTSCTPSLEDANCPVIVSASVQSFVADLQAIVNFPSLPPRA